jgi:hypothetical protein
VEIQLEMAEVGPTSGPTWRLSDLNRVAVVRGSLLREDRVVRPTVAAGQKASGCWRLSKPCVGTVVYSALACPHSPGYFKITRS